MQNQTQSKKKFLTEWIVFLTTSIYFVALLSLFKSSRVDGVRFQEWTSDLMMQAQPIQLLHDSPFQTLWYLHKDPPLLDIIRATLANFFFSNLNGKPLLDSVDSAMYLFHAVIFGLFCALLFRFTKSLIGKTAAILFTIFWCLHPAPLVFATFLDLTFVGSFLVTWFFYEFYRVDKNEGNIYKLALVCIITFYSRSFFQWYLIPLIAMSLLIRGLDRKKVLHFTLICLTGIAPYLIKQKVLFGTLSTSTFVGYHKAGVISYNPSPEDLKAEKEKLNYTYPEKADLYNHGDEYNNRKTVEDNLIFSRLASKKYSENWGWTLGAFYKSFKQNRGKFWFPSSQYIKSHPIRDQLPWSSVYETLINHTALSQITQDCLIGLVIMLIIRRKNIKFLRQVFSYFMPAGILFMSCMFGNRFGWTEVDRLKFFLEPSIYVFDLWMIYQFYSYLKGLSSKRLA